MEWTTLLENQHIYAYVGAFSGYGNSLFNWSGLQWQIEEYLRNHTSFESNTTLVAVQLCGNNDFTFADVAEDNATAQYKELARQVVTNDLAAVG